MPNSKPPNLGDRVLVLEGKVDLVMTTLSSIEHKLDIGATNQTGSRRWAIGIVAMFVVPATVWLSGWMSMLVDPVKTKVERLEENANALTRTREEHDRLLAKVQAENAASIQHRSDIQRQQEGNITRLNELERQHAAMTATYDARLIEFESQMDASSQMENQRMGELHRMLFITWQLGKLGEYPLYPFVESNISNRRALPGGSK